MKSTTEFIVFGVGLTLIGSMFVTELYVDNSWDIQHIHQKISTYILIVYVFMVVAYFGVKKNLKNFKANIKEEICNEVKVELKSELKQELKNEVQKELDNEFKQLISSQVRNQFHRLRVTMDTKNDKAIDDFKKDVMDSLKLELLQDSQLVEFILYKVSNQMQYKNNLIGIEKLHEKFDKITEKMGEGAEK